MTTRSVRAAGRCQQELDAAKAEAARLEACVNELEAINLRLREEPPVRYQEWFVAAQIDRAEAAEGRAEYWKAEHLAGNIQITTLESDNARLGEQVAALEAEMALLRELLDDREKDLQFEYTGRRMAEDKIDEVRQALGVPASISVVDEAARIVLENDEAHAEVARLQAAYDTASDEGYRLSSNLHIAEAEVKRLQSELAAFASCNRARQAAEAEVERLREFQRECLLPHEANDLRNDLDEANAEVERLRKEIATASILLSAAGPQQETWWQKANEWMSTNTHQDMF